MKIYNRVREREGGGSGRRRESMRGGEGREIERGERRGMDCGWPLPKRSWEFLQKNRGREKSVENEVHGPRQKKSKGSLIIRSSHKGRDKRR